MDYSAINTDRQISLKKGILKGALISYNEGYGEVPEWLNGLVSKTRIAARLSRVRIPPFPHYWGKLLSACPFCLVENL